MVLFVLLLKIIFFQTEPKGLTIKIKALDDYILMVLFRFITEESSFYLKQNLKVSPPK